MGIDARIVIKYRGDKPTDDQLARWSWDICRALGAKHFFINDGLPTAEYGPAIAAWHKAFKAHPLCPQYEAGDGAAHKSILEAIGPAPDELRRAIAFARNYEEDEAIRDGRVYSQDGPPVFAADGEWLLEVSVWTRYYGVGYERGDILFICSVAEWVEANMQPCEVWYGGDSSGVLLERFDSAARTKLRQHLYSQSGRDYFNYGMESKFGTPSPCGLCVKGENRFQQYGMGANYAAVSCGGCGKSFETRDSGKTWTVKVDES